jgi:hypothetical protein
VQGWEERLAALRRRTEYLLQTEARPAALTWDEAHAAYARLREAAQPLFDGAVRTYTGLCPYGMPVIEDNRIMGPGGSLGIRFSVWHAFHVAFENAKRPKKEEPKPTGLAGALDIRVKRMPGDPLPPRDPRDRFELATLGLRWDEDRGWVELRRVLPTAWTPEMVAEQFEAYLAGFGYDVAAGLPAQR